MLLVVAAVAASIAAVAASAVAAVAVVAAVAAVVAALHQPGARAAREPRPRRVVGVQILRWVNLEKGVHLLIRTMGGGAERKRKKRGR